MSSYEQLELSNGICNRKSRYYMQSILDLRSTYSHSQQGIVMTYVYTIIVSGNKRRKFKKCAYTNDRTRITECTVSDDIIFSTQIDAHSKVLPQCYFHLLYTYLQFRRRKYMRTRTTLIIIINVKRKTKELIE